MREAQRVVRVAGSSDADLLGEILTDAFADDPVFRWLIPGEGADRTERLSMFFTSMSRTYLRLGKPCYLAGDGSAAAMWGSPGSWALPMAEMAVEAEPQIAAFGERIGIAVELQMQIEGLHPTQPEHWYLAYLGARQASQGQGFGSQLLREVLADADANGTPSYLESSNERNLTLYERHGYEVVEELNALGEGPPIWRMWRDPAS